MRTLFMTLSLGCCLWATAQAGDAASEFYGNSFLCKAQSTGAVCDLWLDANGHYSVFYDSGKKAYVTGVDGDFENEGRTGTYTATQTAQGLKICLTPQADNPARPRGHSPALFHDAGCTTVPAHGVGEVWTFSHEGETYRVSLIRGR